MENQSTPDDDYRQWLEKLRRAVESYTGSPDAFFASLLKSLISSFLGLDTDDRDAPDFEDAATAQERARLNQEYTQSREGAERQRFGEYKKSVGAWNAESLEKSAAKLVELRKVTEAANGGKHVEAISPVDGGRITSEFGHREASATGGVGSTEHKGLDIGPPVAGQNVPVIAPLPGVIVGVGWRGGYGNMIEMVDIYGVHHRFGHLDKVLVKVGDIVGIDPDTNRRNHQQIAVMGSTGHSTGVHLHYEQRDGDGNARAPEIAGQNWGKGQVLAASAEVKPQAPLKTEAPHLVAHVAANHVVKNTLKTKVAAVGEHPAHHAHETAFDHALGQAHAIASDLARKARSVMGLA